MSKMLGIMSFWIPIPVSTTSNCTVSAADFNVARTVTLPRVALDQGVVRRTVPAQIDFLSERKFVVRLDAVEEIRQVEFAPFDLNFAGLDARRLKNLADHNQQVGRPADDLFERAALLPVDRAEHAFFHHAG